MMRYLLLAVTPVLWLALASPAAAQDPVKTNPGVYHLVFENSSVRVLHVTVKPGAKTVMHAHPDNVIVTLSTARMKFTGADGTSIEPSLATDTATWSPAGQHAGENLGQQPIEAILVELKGKAPEGGTPAATRPNMQIAPFFDNDRAMAYKATIEPNFHEAAGTTHDFDQVVIALGDTDNTLVAVGGKTKSHWKRGDALFIGRGVAHESQNNSGKPFDAIIVAIK